MKIKNNSTVGIDYIVIENNGITIYPHAQNPKFVSFCDVSGFKIIVNTYLHTYKSSTSTKISNMKLYITESEYTHELTSTCNINTLYKLISYKRFIGNFKLSIYGPKANIAIPLRIYSRFGIKTSEEHQKYAVPAIVLTIVFLYAIYSDVYMQGITDIRTALMVLYVPILFFLISLIFSIIAGYEEYKKFKIRKMLKL